MKYLNLENLKTIIAECQKIFAGIKHKHTTSDVTGLDEALENAANIVYTTRDEYDQLEKNGTLDSNATYVTTDESDNITDSSVQLWNTSSSLAQQGKYLSYSDQNGGKYLSLMNASDNTTVAHAKLMDGESGEGMDVDADKVKTVDSKGILVEALGETTAQALIDEVAKRVLDLSKETSNLSNETNDLTGRMKSAENSITSLNSNIESSIVVIPSSTIPDYKTGSLCYLRMGKLIIIVCQALGFTTQTNGTTQRTIAGFPESINDVLINSSCISGNVRYGEIYIHGSSLLVRTFTTNPVYGTVCYLTS